MRLRGYQRKAVRQIDAQWRAGHRAVLLVMPPNAGKTVVFESIVRAALKRGERVCVVAPNVVLTQQTIDKFAHVDHGIIWAGHKANPAKLLQIASAPTLVKRLDEYEFDLLVCDESHHCAAETWLKILAAYDTARVLGVTATPKRLDGKGLDKCGFTGLVRGPWVDALTPEFMTPYRMWAPNVPELLDAPEGSDYKASDLAKHGIEMGVLIGDAVKHYTKHCKGKRALAFCMSIEDSKATVKRFKRAGYRAAHMDGSTPHEERQRLLGDLNARRLDLLSSVNVLGEGLDIPGVDVVIQLRPTRSYQVWLQQLGRGFRLDAANPDKVLDVIDCAGNYFRFWSPSVDRGYGLDGKPTLDVERIPTQRRCSECGLVYAADGHGYCPECHAEVRSAGEARETERRAVWRDGELVQVGGGELRVTEPSKGYFVTTKYIDGKQRVVYLGRDRVVAQGRVDKANARWENNDYQWPSCEDALRDWLMVGAKKEELFTPRYNKKENVYFFARQINKTLVQVTLGANKEEAQRRIDNACKKRAENGGSWPETKKEFREWMGCAGHGAEFPMRLSKDNDSRYCTFKHGYKFSLGRDYGKAKTCIDLANRRWRDEGKWPKSRQEIKEWLGLKAEFPIKLRINSIKSKSYFETSRSCSRKSIKVHLGTDPIIAQARVDQANARWEANGYQWPDTPEEFREWLSLPSPAD